MYGSVITHGMLSVIASRGRADNRAFLRASRLWRDPPAAGGGGARGSRGDGCGGVGYCI